MDTTGILSRCMTFSGLDEDQLEAVKNIADKRGFAKGELVFNEGDTANGFYLVAEGRVKVYKMSPEGREQILHIIEPGEPFGEVAVYAGMSFPANAEALEETTCLFFPKKSFVDLIGKNPSLAMNMLGVLSMRLRDFATQIENLVLKDVPSRLAAYLLGLSEEQNDAEGASLTISKTQLSNLLGTIPETLSRVFGKLQEQGLIDVRRSRIRFVDRDRLEEVARNGCLPRNKPTGCPVSAGKQDVKP
ncbi:MAG: Crp/Fnr family transcriptional regulator [Desulfatibacillaceae bacterium]